MHVPSSSLPPLLPLPLRKGDEEEKRKKLF